MAYDEELADRIRDALGPLLAEAVEQKMFGGLAFLLGGNMSVAASGRGGLLVRVDPAEVAGLIGPGVAPMVMGGRQMDNWLHVEAQVLADEEALLEWVDRGAAYARSLPPKKPKPKAKPKA